MTQEHEEINTWIERYSEPLLNRALSTMRNKEDAMDVVQEVFIAAAAAYHTFEGKSTPLTWLLHILKNKTADFYRDKYRKPEVVNMPEVFDRTGAWTDDSVLHEWSRGIEEGEDRHALMNTLDKCIDHLPSQWKVTVKLYYMEEKKANEVCQELNIATTNLWKILQRSRMQLRKCIEVNWFEKL